MSTRWTNIPDSSDSTIKTLIPAEPGLMRALYKHLAFMNSLQVQYQCLGDYLGLYNVCVLNIDITNWLLGGGIKADCFIVATGAAVILSNTKV